MESFLGWFGQIIEWFGLFIPRRVVVRKTDKMIKFKWDGSVVAKEPGLRWYLPFTTEIVEITVARQPLNIRATFFTTKDNIACMADCAVTYYIDDPITFLTENHDGYNALAESINAALCKKLRAMDFKDIQNTETIDAELTECITADAESFGVDIEYVRLQNFTYTIPICLHGQGGYKNDYPVD